MATAPIVSLSDALRVFDEQDAQRLRDANELINQARIRAEQQAAQAAAQLAAEEQAAAAAAAAAAAEVAQQPAAAATGTPTPSTRPSLLDQVVQSKFAKEFLPTQRTLTGDAMDVNYFYSVLPFDERKKITDAYVMQKKAEGKINDDALTQVNAQMSAVVYADNGGKPPSLSSRLFTDLLDKSADSLRSGVLSAGAAAASTLGFNETGDALRRQNTEGAKENRERFSAATLDVERRRAFRDAQARQPNAPERGVTDAVTDFLGDAVRAPAATIGEIVGGTAPVLAATVVNPLLGAGTAAALAGGGANEAAYQEALRRGMTPAQARAAVETFGSLASQASAAALAAVFTRYGLEAGIGRGAAPLGVARTTAVEAVEGAAESLPTQAAINTAVGDPLTKDMASQALLGAAQEAVGGAAMAPVLNLANRVSTTSPNPTTSPEDAAATTSQATPAPASVSDGDAPAQLFDAPQQALDMINLQASNPAAAQDAQSILDALFASPEPVTRTQIEQAGFVLRDDPTLAPRDTPADTPAPADTPPTPSPQNIARRDDTNVADIALPADVVQALQADTPVDARNVMEAISLTGSTPMVRGMSRFLSQKLVQSNAYLQQDLTIAGVDGLTVTDRSTQEQLPAAGVLTIDPTGTVNTVRLDRSTGLTEETAIHEVFHSVTQAALTAPSTQLTGVQRAARNDLNALHQFAVTTTDMGRTFTIPDVKEFVSEAMGNPRMQSQMRATPYNKQLSVWGKFKQTLRGMVGMDNMQVPDNMLDAALVAVDGLTRAGVTPLAPATYSAAAAAAAAELGSRVRPPPPPDPDQAFFDAMERKENAAKTDVIDFLEARFRDDPKDLMRGSAFLDRATGTWRARFVFDDGKVYDNQTPLTTQAQAESFLNRFINPISKDKSIVVSKSKGSGYTANYDGVRTVLETMRPGTNAVYTAAINAGVPPHAAHTVAKWRDGWTRHAFSRLSALDAIDDGAEGRGSLRERAILRRASLLADASRQGNVGTMSLRDLTKAMRSNVDTAVGADPLLSRDTVHDYMYAASAAQQNKMQAAVGTLDAYGRERFRGEDFAGFKYYARPDGSITSAGDLSAREVSGADAPAKYMAAFAQQYPSAMGSVAAALDSVRAINEHTIGVQLENGAIGPADAAKMGAQDLYLPKRQVEKLNARTPRGIQGRTTKAVDPVAQLDVISRARVQHAAYTGMLADMVAQLRRNPMPNVATLNAYDVRALRTGIENTTTGDVTYATLVKNDWIGEDTVRVWVGDQAMKVTIKDPTLLKALKPGDNSHPVLQAMSTVTNMASMLMTATPSFWLKAAGWDLVTILGTTQGAFSTATDKMPLVASYAQVIRTYKNALPALADAARTTLERDVVSPLRRLYNASGGGVVFGKEYTLQDSIVDAAPRGDLLSLRKSASVIPAALNVGSHVMSDAVRFAAFKAFLEAKHGAPLNTQGEIEAFVRANPEALETALTGSKKLLGNYEDMGQGILLRSVVPFYSAAAVGVGQTLPRILTTNQGITSMSVLAATAFATAVAAMDEKEDSDNDGFGKFLRRNSTWEGINIDGTVVPVPHEMRLAMLAGYAAAYQMSGNNNPQDVENITKRAIKTVVQSTLLPVPGLDIEQELFAQMGPLGALVQLAATPNDMFGRSRVSGRADSGWDKKLNPYYMSPRGSDTAAGVETSKFLWENAGINIAPASADIWVNMFAGGWAGLMRANEKGLAEGKTSGEIFGKWLLRGYSQSDDNLFNSIDLWEREHSTATHANAFDKASFAAHAKEVDKLVRPIGQINYDLGEARRAQDVPRFIDLQDKLRSASKSVDEKRREWYEQSGQQNRDLLRD